MSKAYFKRVVLDVLRFDLSVSMSTKIVEYFREKHPDIYDKALEYAIEASQEKIENIIKALDEGKDNAKVQEEDNPTHGV